MLRLTCLIFIVTIFPINSFAINKINSRKPASVDVKVGVYKSIDNIAEVLMSESSMMTDSKCHRQAMDSEVARAYIASGCFISSLEISENKDEYPNMKGFVVNTQYKCAGKLYSQYTTFCESK